MRTLITKTVLGLTLLSACVGPVACVGSDPPPPRRNCGLPTPEQRVASDVVPAAFLPVKETEVVQVAPREDRIIVTMSVPASVRGSFDAYRQSVAKAGFEILLKDFEGFEAELYLKKEDYLAVVEIRVSDCDDVSVVRLNLPSEAS